MNVNPTILARECRIFTRFIARAPATQYVIDKYVEAHRGTSMFVAAGRLDRMLVGAAHWSPTVTRVIDAAARVWAPRSVLRRKLILLLAILETSSPTFRGIDYDPPRTLPKMMLHLAALGSVGALTALLGSPVFFVLRLFARERSHRGV